MDAKKLCTVLRRKVDTALKEKNQTFKKPSKLTIRYSEFSEKTCQHIIKVTVTGIISTFYNEKGVGFPMVTMFDTLKELGCYMDGTAKSVDDGDTYIYTYVISNECAAKLLNP